MKARYGISRIEFELLVKKQRRKCRICGRVKKLFIDHCHKKKIVRGLLCTNCNVALGHLKDSIPFLKRAISYLRGEMEATTLEDRAAEREQEKKEDLFDTYKNTVKDVRYVLKQYGRKDPTVTLECINKLINNPKLKKSKTKK